MGNTGSSKFKVVFQAEIDSSSLQKQVNKVSGKKINLGAGQANKNVKSLTSNLGHAVKKTIEWSMAMGLVYKSLQQIGDGVRYIKDLDKEMTNIQVVTGKTDDQINALAGDFNSLAKEMSATTLEVAQGSLEWFRQGKTVQEANELTKASIVASKLAAMDSAQATEYLTSIMNGFKLEAEDAMGVLDKLVEVDNLSATSVAELAEALKRSSNSARQAGVDFDTLTSYIATISSVTRKSAGSIGESMKTLFARMQNLKIGKLDEMGESASDVEKVLQKFTTTTLFDAQGQFRDMDKVIFELSQQWETLGRVERSAVAGSIAGVRQRENFLVLMDNFNMSLEFQEMQLDSTGRAMERFGIYEESVEAATNRLKAAWEGMWAETVDSDAITWFYNLGASLLTFIDDAGGLEPLLIGVAGALLIFNKQVAVTVSLMMSKSIPNFAIGIANIAKAISAGNLITLMQNTALQAVKMGGALTTLGTMLSPAGVIGIGLIALTAMWMQYNRTVKVNIEQSKEGAELVQSSWVAMFDKQAQSVGDAIGLLDAYSIGLNAVRDGYEEATWAQKLWINQNELIVGGLEAFIDQAKESSNGWADYNDAVQKAAEMSGYLIDENGKLYSEERDHYGILQKTYTGTTVLTRAKYQHLEAISQVTAAQKEQVSDGDLWLSQLTDQEREVYDLTQALSYLTDGISSSVDIIQRASDKSLTFDDIDTLKDLYTDWTDLLVIEGDIISVNTDKMIAMNIQKAKSAKIAMIGSGASDKELEVMDAYISQLERSLPLSKEYTDVLEQISIKVGESSAGFAGVSTEIAEISQQFEEGRLSASEYFDELQIRIDEIDFGKFSSEESQLMFSGLVHDATSSLAQITTMFDAGEISILEYSDQLTQLNGIFQTLGSAGASAGMDVESSMGLMAGATEQLIGLQELNNEITKVVYEQNINNMEHGSEGFAVYAHNISQLAIDSGVAFTDMQGNALTSAEQIENYLMASNANFNNFTGQSADATATAISKLLMSAGDLIVEFGNSIGDFSASIDFVPYFDETNQVPLPGLLGEMGMTIPAFGLDVGANVSGMEGIQSAVVGIGESIQDYANTFSLDPSMYNLDAPVNQVTDSGGFGSGLGDVSNSFDNIANSIQNAADATDDLAKKTEDWKKAQIDALKAQLEAYNRIIDKRKDLLDSMKKERSYQDDLEDKQKDITDIKEELLELSLDDTEEARAKRAILEEELAEKVKDLDSFQFEHGIDKQMDALNTEQERFEQEIADKIKIVESIEATSLKDFIAKLQSALGYIPTEQKKIPSLPASMSTSPSIHSPNRPFSGNMADMMRGGRGFAQPETSGAGGGLSVDKMIEINVSGNLDESVIPDIEAIASKVIAKINESMSMRGYNRRAESYSI